MVALLAGASETAWGVEPARQFLTALREHGYHDQALEYLDQMANSPLAPVDLKETLIYEKGVTLLEASRAQRDVGLREKQIQDAQQLLQDFIAQRGDHAMANAARNQMANLVTERARIKMELAKKADKAKNLAEARKLYEESFQVFNKLREDLNSKIEQLPKFVDAKDAQQQLLAEKRDQLRTDYLHTLLLGAAIREEMADTVERGSKENTEFLTEAANLYNSIYALYRIRIAGQYARMYQGRCMQKLKKFKDALGYLGEVLDQPDSPDEFRTLKTKALKYAMECWLDPSERKYVEAIKRGTDWTDKSRPKEDRDPEWLVLRLYLAKARVMQADELKKANPNDKSINSALSEARKLATYVARFPSDYQKEAQAMVAQLGGVNRGTEKGEAKTFAEALKFGKEAIEGVQTASILLEQLPGRIAQEQHAKVKSELQQQLDEAQKSIVASQDEAMNNFQIALRLADRETELSDLNLVRYFLCYLYFTQSQFYDAALTGEFVAQRYPDHSSARQCAKIAMASYLKLYAENQTEDKQFETDHIVSVAEFISTKWPGQPEAEEALSTLVPFMINAGQLDRALAFLNKIPESSGKRGEAELKTGQAVWAAHLKGVQEVVKWEQDGIPAGVDVNARKAELESLKKRAMEILSTGYTRIKQKGVPDRMAVLALLSLAQVYVESQQPLEAIEVLEHAQLGPLTLVRQGHPAAQDQGISEETYKTALRAYIGALTVSPDRAAMLAKAQDTMTNMKSAIGGAAGGQDRLVAVFVSLARSLEAQLKVAPPDTKLALSQGFESFLKQIREETTEFNVLNWVAETFMSLGSGFDTGRTPTAESVRFYQESRTTFDKMLKEMKPAPQMMTQVQMRLANLYRKQRDFKTAINTYVNVLTENPMLINVQVEAARTFQDWANTPGQEALFGQAIAGYQPGKDGKNIIWGWGRISQITARHSQFRDTFHEANINLARCRVLYAQKQTGEAKEKLLKIAMNGVVVVRRLYPELGGPTWVPQYDTVVKQIQQAKGENPAGLKAIPAPSSVPPPAAGSAPKT